MTRAIYMAFVFLMATAVVQANQCSGGSECPSDINPNNVASVLETKLQMGVLNDGGEDNHCSSGGGCPSDDSPKHVASMFQTKLRMHMLKVGGEADASEVYHGTESLVGKMTGQLGKLMLKGNPNAILAELEEKVSSGVAPTFDVMSKIKRLILEEILPDVEVAKDAAVQDTAAWLSAVGRCNNEFKSSEAYPGSTLHQDVNLSRLAHSTCRHDLQSMNTSYCVKLDKLVNDTCPSTTNIPDTSTRATAVQHAKDIVQAGDNCTDQEQKLADKQVECVADQTSFESGFCYWKTELESDCKSLDRCYSDSLDDYNGHVAKMKILWEKWDVETVTLQKILCYCNLWLDEEDEGDGRAQTNATHFHVCNNITHTPSLAIPEPPEKVDCLLTSVANHPGEKSFITREYGSSIDFVAPLVPCIEAPTSVPSTVAPTTTQALTTEVPTTEAPSTEAPTTEALTTEVPTTEAPSTEAPTTEACLNDLSYTSTGESYSSSRGTSNLASPSVDWSGSNDWLTQKHRKQDATVTFTLGAPGSVTSFDIWNQNEYSGGNTRDVKGIAILYSHDGSTFQPATTAELANSNRAKPNPKIVVQLPATLPSAQYWRIKLTSFWSSNAHAGLMRVVINGCSDKALTTEVPTTEALSTEAPTTQAIQMTRSAQGHFNCVVSDNSQVKCWGSNDYGQLGYGDKKPHGDESGEMGDSLLPIDLGNGRLPTVLSSGEKGNCVLLDNSQLKCWGDNWMGQLGYGDKNHRGDESGEMGDSLLPIDLGKGRFPTALSSGAVHTCVVLDNSQLKCWGFNQYGALGYGDTRVRGDGQMGDYLLPIDLGNGCFPSALATGHQHTCVVLDNSQFKCWGDNRFGQLGYGDKNHRGDESGEMGNSLLPIDLGNGRFPTALVQLGFHHGCVVLDNSQLKCWGWNGYGHLGYGDTNHRGDGSGEMGDSLLPIDLGSGRFPTALGTGHSHNCVILDNSQLKCWGGNYRGQLGYGDKNDRGDESGEMGDSLPPIDLGNGRFPTALSLAPHTTCVLLDNSQLKCWGGNWNGQLGYGDTHYRGDAGGEMGDALLPVDLGI